MGDEYIDKLYNLLEKNINQQEAYRKENNILMKEQTGAIIKNTTVMEEVKIALQSKPCIVREKTEELNKGWKDSSISFNKWIIYSLLFLITGILTAVGLYSAPTTHIIK